MLLRGAEEMDMKEVKKEIEEIFSGVKQAGLVVVAFHRSTRHRRCRPRSSQ
jgi:hypothetical protein